MRRARPVDLAVDTLATFRLTRLITEDTLPVIKKSREWIWRRFPPVGHYLDEEEWQVVDQDTAVRRWKLLGVSRRTEVRVTPKTPNAAHAVVIEAHPLGELIGCPWCVSTYCAMFVVCARIIAPTQWDVLARVLAMSAVTGVIASH